MFSSSTGNVPPSAGVSSFHSSPVPSREIVLGYFLSVSLVVGETAEEHAVFDVRWRKNPADNTVSFFTSDVPPVPARRDLSLKANFWVENAIGVSPLRHKLGQTAFNCNDLETHSSNPSNITNYAKGEQMLVATLDTGEWHFIRRTEPSVGRHWLVSYVSVKVQYPHVRRFLLSG